MLVSCSKNIITHNTDVTTPMSVFNPHQSMINCAVWNHNNQVIASCGNDGAIFLSHSSKAQILLQLEDEQPSRPILSVAFTSNSQFLASGGADGLVKVWDLKKKSLLHTLKGHFSQVNSVSWNNLDSLIASCSNAGEIIIHDLNTQVNVANFSNTTKTPGYKCVKFSPMKKTNLISGSNCGSLTVWDVTLRSQVCQFPQQHSSKISAIACSVHNENLVCSAGIDQKVNFYDTQSKSVMRTLQCDNPLTAMAFQNDGHTLAVGTLYGSIMVYDLRQTSQPKKVLKGHESNSVNYMEFVRQEESLSKASSLKILNNENTIPKSEPLKSTVQQLSSLEEIKKETLQRLEAQKLEKQRLSSAKPPAPVVPTSATQGLAESGQKSFSQIKQTFESYSGKIEDLNKKYDKRSDSLNQTQLQQQTLTHHSSGGFSEEQKSYLNQLFSEHLQQVKHYVSEQIGSLHIDMIRQFSIQQNDFQSMFDRYLYDQNLLTQRIQQLENENTQLKRHTY